MSFRCPGVYGRRARAGQLCPSRTRLRDGPRGLRI